MNANKLDSSAGARLVTSDGRPLPLRKTHLEARARAGIARSTLRQTFFNPNEEPLRVRYLLPLPADGAVVGFSFTLRGVRTDGRVKSREAARQDFERALVEGRSGALLEQERSSLFSQEIGNIPPGEQVEVEVSVDQPLAWLSEGSWSFRFPTVVGPRYLGAPGRTPDAEKVTVPLAERPEDIDARATLELDLGDEPVGAPRSPSHPLRVDGAKIRLAEDTRLDRDLVVEWPVAGPKPGCALDVGRPSAGHPREGDGFALLTLVPPKRPTKAVPRDLILLVDVSGSMHGEPLDQAKRVLRALVDRLREDDRLEMIAFANEPVRWLRKPRAMDDKGRAEADRWLEKLGAAGSTEMQKGIIEALRPLRDGALRQVVLVTDGYVGFEAEIVAAVKARLPRSARVHTLGVGSSVNRSLTGPVARMGGGIERVVAPGEDAEIHAARLLAATDQPLVTELNLSGSALRELGVARLPELYAGAPALVPLRLDPNGGQLRVTGRTAEGPWTMDLDVASAAPGTGSSAPAAAFARARVEDLEAESSAAGADARALDAHIETLGIEFQIATRRTSWVAISDTATVDPSVPTRFTDMPHLVPQGMAYAMPSPPRSPPLGAMRKRASMLSPKRAVFGLDEEMSDTGLGERAYGPPLEFELDALLMDAEKPPQREEAEQKGQAPERPRWFHATLRHSDEASMTIEFEVTEAALNWTRPTEVTIRTPDGDRVTVQVDALRTTATGRVQTGCLIRLVLRTPKVAAVEVELDGLRLRL